jgi:hypothetical protein
MDAKRKVIYTDVPQEVLSWVEEQARRLMISKAAVVRQVLAKEVEKQISEGNRHAVVHN